MTTPNNDALQNIDYEKYSLSSLFDLGWKLQLDLEKQSEESSASYQLRRTRLIELFKKCEFMLDELHIYSSNEEIDEISTSELRYMMIYAILAWLHEKISATSAQQRVPELRASREYFHKFLSLTRSYGLHSFDIEKRSAQEQNQTANISSQATFDQNMISQAYDRNEKIRRFKEQKELESQLASMYTALSAAHLDDEQRRKCFKTFLRFWVNKSIDDLKLVNDEIRLLDTLRNTEGDGGPNNTASASAAASARHPHNFTSASKPFIITKDALQAQVFGAGYPSLPVLSIGQFYDQLAEKGMMPPAISSGCHGHAHEERSDEPVQIGGGVTETQKAQEKAEQDEREDQHDDEELRKQREWDEFKDENKRGSGNRYNRS